MRRVLTVCVSSELHRDGLAPMPDGVRVLVWDGSSEPPDDIADTEFLLAEYAASEQGRDVLARMPRLRVVQLTSAGVEAWRPLVPDGVLLCNGRGIHGSSTAEIAVAGILYLTRNFPYFAAEQLAGRWSPASTEDLDEARVLVLGAGDIGRCVGAALEVFGAHITYVGRTARDGVSEIGQLPVLLPHARIVVAAMPLTNATRGLLNATALAALPEGAIVANVSRGPIVDTGALVAELQAGRLRAFLDVTDPEPLPEGHPLWQTPGVVLTPHVGGGTHGWQQRALRLARQQIERCLDGAPMLNVVGSEY